LAVALDDAELGDRLLQARQPAAKLLQAAAKLRRLHARRRQIAQRLDAGHLLKVEEANAEGRLDRLDESRAQPSPQPVARYAQQPAKLRHRVQAVDLVRAFAQAEALE